MGLRILEPGFHTLVVDHGRPGFRSFGVPVSGAADRFSLAVGNALVGNSPNAAALEVSLVGPTLQADCELGCVLFGAPFALSCGRRRLRAGVTFSLERGEELAIGGTPNRMRAYLCVRGGIASRPVLKSLSSLHPLKAGAKLNCSAAKIAARFVHQEFAWDREPRKLRAIDGPQAAWFHSEAFYAQEYRVTEASDRMGIRLQNESVFPVGREMVSEPVCPGTVQVSGDSQCIMLGVDAQTIGGYPKIAQVISADIDKIGQLRPGDRLRFEKVCLEEAEIIYRQKQRELREWVTRLQATVRS
jgi:antagonist of KipI